MQDAAVMFTRNFAVDAHRADEDDASNARLVHRADDVLGLLLHVASKARVHDTWVQPAFS
jgi:hypothetical protein